MGARPSPAVDLVASLPAFGLAVGLISVAPGPAMALVIRWAAIRGTRGTVPVVLGLEAGLCLALAAGVARAGSWFRRLRIRRRLEAVSGTVLVALGLRVAASSR
jgi:threonine/homoserine/homoserine lactone efflux protein